MPKTQPLERGRPPFLPEWTARGIFLYAAASLYFYLPVAMPIRYGIHRFVDPNGRWTFLAYPETWAIILLAVLAVASLGLSKAVRNVWQDKAFVIILACAGVYVLVLAASSFLQGSDFNFALRRISVGWILPILLGASLRACWSGRLDAMILRSVIQGSFLLMIVGVITYYASFGIPAGFVEHVFTNRTYLVWKGMAGGISFSEIPMGGVNVLAGHLVTVTCLVMAAAASTPPRLKAGFLIGWLSLAAVVEYLCFSRGAFLCMFLLTLAMAALHPTLRRSLRGRAMQAVIVLLILANFAPAQSRTYWIDQLTVDEGSTSFSRLEQMRTLLNVEKVSDSELPDSGKRKRSPPSGSEAAARREPPAPEAAKLAGMERRQASRPAPLAAGPSAEPPESQAERSSNEELEKRIGGCLRRILLGYGLGNYGLLRGLVRDSGTHNIFLNAMVDAGIAGFLLFVALFTAGAWRRLQGWLAVRGTYSLNRSGLELGRLAALASIIIIGVLVDYRLENLGTLTGAAIFWYLLAAPEPSADSEHD